MSGEAEVAIAAGGGGGDIELPEFPPGPANLRALRELGPTFSASERQLPEFAARLHSQMNWPKAGPSWGGSTAAELAILTGVSEKTIKRIVAPFRRSPGGSSDPPPDLGDGTRREPDVRKDDQPDGQAVKDINKERQAAGLCPVQQGKDIESLRGILRAFLDDCDPESAKKIVRVLDQFRKKFNAIQ